jgi:hypothetical protein
MNNEEFLLDFDNEESGRNISMAKINSEGNFE